MKRQDQSFSGIAGCLLHEGFLRPLSLCEKGIGKEETDAAQI
ncbi:hypothetical protein [Weizmannia acidilactici]|nr:hypothetical protein [Weizmannia acidilactici]